MGGNRKKISHLKKKKGNVIFGFANAFSDSFFSRTRTQRLMAAMKLQLNLFLILQCAVLRCLTFGVS